MKKVTIKTPERRPEIEKAKKIYKLIGEVTNKIDAQVNSVQDLSLLFNSEMCLFEDRLQEYCEKMMLLLPDQYGRKVEDFIWRKGFYDIIQVVKQNINEVQKDRELKERYREYLLSGVGYYNRLYYKLKKEFGGDISGSGVVGGGGGFMVAKNNKRSRRQMDEKTKDWWEHACQRCLVYMGDLVRYQFLLDRRPCDQLQAQLFYNMAISALPSSGLPYKQLGILSHTENKIYDTIYYYLRCIISSNNNGEADKNLALLFQKNKLDLNKNNNNNNDNNNNRNSNNRNSNNNNRNSNNRNMNNNNRNNNNRNSDNRNNNDSDNGGNDRGYKDKEDRCLSERDIVMQVVGLMEIFYDSESISVDASAHQKCQSVLKLINNKFMHKSRTATPLVDINSKKNVNASSDGAELLKIATIFICLTHILEKKNSNLSAIAMAFSIAMFSHVLNHVLSTLHGYRRTKKRAGKQDDVRKRILGKNESKENNDKMNDEDEDDDHDHDHASIHVSKKKTFKLKRRRRRWNSDDDDDNDEEDEVSDDFDYDDSYGEEDEEDDDLSEGVYDSDDNILRGSASSISSAEGKSKVNRNKNNDNKDYNDDEDNDDAFTTLRAPAYYKKVKKASEVGGKNGKDKNITTVDDDKTMEVNDNDDDNNNDDNNNRIIENIKNDNNDNIDNDNDDNDNDDNDNNDNVNKENANKANGNNDNASNDNGNGHPPNNAFFQAISIPPGYEDSTEQRHVMEINHKLINFTIDTDSDTYLSQNDQEYSYDEPTRKDGELERQFELRYVRRVVEKLVWCDLIGPICLFTQWLLANHIVASVCAQSSSVIWQRLSTLFNYIPDLELILACFQNINNNNIDDNNNKSNKNNGSDAKHSNINRNINNISVNAGDLRHCTNTSKSKLSNNFLDAIKLENENAAYLKEDYDLRDFPPLKSIQPDFDFTKTTNLPVREQAILRLLRLRNDGMKLANRSSLPLNFHQSEQNFYTTPTSMLTNEDGAKDNNVTNISRNNKFDGIKDNNNNNNRDNREKNTIKKENSLESINQKQQHQKPLQLQQQQQQHIQQQHLQQQQQLMRNMAQLRLQAQVNQLESTLKGTNKNQPLYLICHTPSLCEQWTLIKQICNSGKFLLIVPLAAIDQLDRWKGGQRRAREVVRWLEQQFERASKVIRAQRSNEVTLPHHKLTPLKEDPDKAAYMRTIDCCKYFVRKDKGNNTKNESNDDGDSRRSGLENSGKGFGDIVGGFGDSEDGRSVCFLSAWGVESSELNEVMRRSLKEALDEGLLLEDVKTFHDRWNKQ